MSNRPAVIQATYANWKPIPSRKVLQLVFEVPWEQQHDVLSILGPPSVETSQWYAIAKLVPQTQSESAGGASTNPGPSTSPHPSQQLQEMSPDNSGQSRDKPAYKRSQIAFLKCKDPAFREWFTGRPESTFEGANERLKLFLGIESKTELDTHGPAAEKFDRLMTDYDTRHLVRG